MSNPNWPHSQPAPVPHMPNGFPNAGQNSPPRYNVGGDATHPEAGTGNRNAVQQAWKATNVQAGYLGEDYQLSGDVLTEEYERNKKPKWIIAGIITTCVVVMALVASGAFIFIKVSGTPVTGGTGGDNFTQWAVTEYGEFEEIVLTGNGREIVDLPPEAKAIYVTYSYEGRSTFDITGVDKNNAPSYALSVFAYGHTAGATFGVTDVGWSEPMTRLKVDGSGDWEVAIKPASAIPEFQGAGSDSSVMRYTGEETDLHIDYQGNKYFSIRYYSKGNEFPEYLANETDSWSGSAPIQTGPGIFVITTEGGWTLTP